MRISDWSSDVCSSDLFSGFGSGITGPKSGILLQNRGMAFSLDPDHPNCIAPGKRPMHTIIPGMMAQGERVVMPFGVMGGAYQACGHARLVTNLVDFGLDVQQSIDLARLFPPPDETEEIGRAACRERGGQYG